MDAVSSRALQHFKNDVGIRFQLYNSLFTSLPFHKIEKTGILLSLLSNLCEEGYAKGRSPVDILEEFFVKHTAFDHEKEKMDLLFRFVQYAERQVVLFDALEDASYKGFHDLNGAGTMKQLIAEVEQNNKQEALKKVLEDFSVRLVLTAHPTQFYPGSVLGIIHDLSRALAKNDASEVNVLLQQLGRTAFFKKKKPTPYDEAISLVWYLENIFYSAAGRIMGPLKRHFPEAINRKNTVLKMGFWPGGDRDGNPFVTADTTLKVADALRGGILKCYYLEVRRIKRRLTFQGCDELLTNLEKKLYDNLFIPGYRTDITKEEIRDTLQEIRRIIIEQHNGLFVELVQGMLNKLDVFGMHFASLDVRQESTIHQKLFENLAAKKQGFLPNNYAVLSEREKVKALLAIQRQVSPSDIENPVEKDTLEVVSTIQTIQNYNGEEGCHRYIISQCNSVLNVIEVFALFKANGIAEEDIHVDIVPLFETIDDLRNAADIMRELYAIPAYKAHLNRRGKTQTIMLGFSDGTKDGGYLMANWSIYRAKEELTSITRQYGFEVVFFDGRGGPPARGGGKTHKFYASMGNNISNKEIQLTIQGQTVSANFGIIDAAQFNMEQLLNAGITNQLFSERHAPLNIHEEELMQELSSYGFDAYKKLKDHSLLADYLYEVSPLRFYNETNIGSRPAKRGKSTGATLKDLRAIPFTGSWSQLKQNVPGFFGVGSALKKMEYIGKFEELRELYSSSLYFKTLLDNCEMAMSKSNFQVTSFLAKDEKFGEIWQMIYNEYKLTKEYVLKLSGNDSLMADYPTNKLSISMRERIVLPLVTIQQYAIAKMRALEDMEDAREERDNLGKLVMRCSFGIINAGRNSA
ncbi:MAG: phosphoenolpyruvate carboxylase [Niabella sp.]